MTRRNRLRALALAAALGLLPALALGQKAPGTAETPAVTPLPDAEPFPVDPDAPTLPPGGDVVELQGLDKIGAKVTVIDVPIGQSVDYGNLIITARYCRSAPPTEPPETKAFLEIDEAPPGEAKKRIFSGWMFASSPALSSIEHPVYDISVLSCKTSSGDTASGNK
jgi:hypothetical protein